MLIIFIKFAYFDEIILNFLIFVHFFDKNGRKSEKYPPPNIKN